MVGSSTEETCSYRFNHEQWEAEAEWLTDDDLIRSQDVAPDGWTCPHSPHTDADRCVFHLGDEQREKLGVSDADVRTEFIDCVRNSSRSTAFIGANLAHLDLNYRVLGGEENHPIDLRQSTIGKLRLSGAVVARPITVDYADIASLEGTSARFQDTASFTGARIASTSFIGAEFRGETTFSRAVLLNRTAFGRARFEKRASFVATVFDDTTSFTRAIFDGEADFNNARFRDEALFDYVTYRNFAAFSETTFHGQVIHNNGTFGDVAVYDGTTFLDTITFAKSDFSADLTFEDATFEDRIELSECRVADRLQIEGTATSDVQLSDIYIGGRLTADIEPADGVSIEIVCENGTIPDGRVTLQTDGRARWRFREATLGDVQFEPNDFELFEYLDLSNVKFDGFDFQSHRTHLLPEWDLHTFVDTPEVDPSVAETTYLNAKNGAQSAGDQPAAAKFFQREMRFRRKSNIEAFWRGEGLDRVRAGYDAITNLLFDLTCGYGEQPSKVVLFSTGIVLTFAGIFMGTGVTLPYGTSPVDYLVFSLQAFVALIFGPIPDIELRYVRFLAAVQAFVGAFFIALFVFTLTRSVHR